MGSFTGNKGTYPGIGDLRFEKISRKEPLGLFHQNVSEPPGNRTQ